MSDSIMGIRLFCPVPKIGLYNDDELAACWMIVRNARPLGLVCAAEATMSSYRRAVGNAVTAPKRDEETLSTT
jgi:hypothetical protein